MHLAHRPNDILHSSIQFWADAAAPPASVFVTSCQNYKDMKYAHLQSQEVIVFSNISANRSLLCRCLFLPGN